jgi:hypothetical protein
MRYRSTHSRLRKTNLDPNPALTPRLISAKKVDRSSGKIVSYSNQMTIHKTAALINSRSKTSLRNRPSESWTVAGESRGLIELIVAVRIAMMD